MSLLVRPNGVVSASGSHTVEAVQYHFVTLTKCREASPDEQLERVAEVAHGIAADLEAGKCYAMAAPAQTLVF